MSQASNGACLGEKAFHLMSDQRSVQHFNGGLGVQMNMFTQIDFREVPLPEKVHEAIVAQLLSLMISHDLTSCWQRTDTFTSAPLQNEPDREKEGYSQGGS